jgi:nucleotidyltransferase AbiEii toxin of type IV toxin-antitoxin system
MYTWAVPFQLPPIESDGIRLAGLPDVAALKLEAIINRKEGKDFRDIYALLQGFSLKTLLDFFHERYPHHSLRVPTDHLLAAPFVERDLSILLFQKTSWEETASFIAKAVKLFYEEKKKEKEALEAKQLQQRLENIRRKKE